MHIYCVRNYVYIKAIKKTGGGGKFTLNFYHGPFPLNILLNYYVNDAKRCAKYHITVHVNTISLDRLVRDLIETCGTILRNT